MRRRCRSGNGELHAAAMSSVVSLLLLFGSERASAQVGKPPFLAPSAIAYDVAGNLFIADEGRNQVFEATLAGTLVIVAGTGVQGFAGDGGQATSAELNSPQGLAFGSDGTLYIADTGNARIRAVRAGVVTTYAGTGSTGSGGDGGSLAQASFDQPTALAVEVSGGLLICDTGDHRVRRISGGVVTTAVGTGVQGFAGDEGPATMAELDSPMGIAVGADGRIFIADSHNQRVRAIAPDGTIKTFAGTGQRGFAGDGGPAVAAQLAGPRGLTLATDGSLLIADTENQRIRSVTRVGVITSVLGSGIEGASADGSLGASAALHSPRALAISSFGMPVLVDKLNGVVRVLTSTGTLYLPAAIAPSRSSTLQVTPGLAEMYGSASAEVVASGAVAVPRGTVTLSEGGTALASATLASGAAGIDISSLEAGTHNLQVNYGGDGLNPAASGTFPLSISSAQAVATANGATMLYGSLLPMLSGSLSGILPQDAGQVSAVFSVNAGALADVGTYPISAALTGIKSINYALSLSPSSGSLKVIQANSTTSLAVLPQSYAGLPLRLSAAVAAGTSGQPTGSVQFLNGSTVIASAALSDGSASSVYAAPPDGTLHLTALYSGSLDFASSASAVQDTVISAMPDFTLAAAGAASASVLAGSSATYNVVVQAQPAPFTGLVSFSVTGLPAGAAANFSPAQVVPGTGSATVTLGVQTAATTVSLPRPQGSTATWVMAGAALWWGWNRRRRRVLAGLFGAALFLAGCGARTVGEAEGGLTTHNYTLQVVGTSTNLVGSTVSHVTKLTLSVQE